ncbi:MAG: LLM class flavin-dependent oxidoreductase, partial [Acidimicrobiales bacterium]
GSVREMLQWAERAERAGLDSVWLHESYFERDAITYASALAERIPRLEIALGALSPLTRNPVLTAMTVSSLDDMAPGRIICGLGSGLPLRLTQMRVPYTPAGAITQIGEAIDTMRALWRGERIPVPGAPELVPMFAPVHRVPIYVAGYRTAMVELAAAKADGYLARPAESLASLAGIIERLRRAEAAAGRPAGSVITAGYLLSLVGPNRREALNRAKREPFVIYMMSVLSDLSLDRAGLPHQLRDEVAAAWRAEEYHRAAGLLPDELLDAFLLCGSPEDVAERAWQFQQVGLDRPLLQPVVQDDDQIDGVITAATILGRSGYAGASSGVAVPSRSGLRGPAGEGRSAPVGAGAGGARAMAGRRPIGDRLSAWWEIIRPFSLTASAVPVAAAVALAAAAPGRLRWTLAVAALVAATFIHLGTNIVNEVFDVRKGVDTITTPRASLAILRGRISEREALGLAGAFLAGAVAVGAWMAYVRGWPVILLGTVGIAGGVGYTAPPLRLKYRALGLPVVFALMGPVMVEGTYYVLRAGLSAGALAVSVPVGLLVTAILHGNEWRDIADDARAGISTVSIRIGGRAAHLGYVGLVMGAFLAVTAAVVVGAIPRQAAAADLSAPLLVAVVRAADLGARGERRSIAKIDLSTARLHAVFGALLVAGLALAA